MLGGESGRRLGFECGAFGDCFVAFGQSLTQGAALGLQPGELCQAGVGNDSLLLEGVESGFELLTQMGIGPIAVGRCILGMRIPAMWARCLSRRVAACRSILPPWMLRRSGPLVRSLMA